MKRILIISFCLVTVAGFQSCVKQLEEDNVRVPTADSYYTTAKGFGDLINSCYTQARSQLNGDAVAMSLYGTDLWTHASDAGADEFNSYLPSLNATDNILYNFWADYYLGIAACNTAISRAGGVTDMDQSALDSKLGEAYFLRAWYYSKLVVQFGDLPLMTQEVTKTETTGSRASEDSVYQLIIDDLLKAEQMLPASQSDFGRATKPAAEALLARVYLTRNENEKAAQLAETVINDYGFALLGDYAALWDPNNEENSEIIWSIQFSKDSRLSEPASSLHLYFTPRYDLHPGMTRALNYDRPYPRYMATRFYLDLMQTNRWKDSRYDKSWREVYLANYEPTLPAGMKIGDTAYMVVPYSVPQSVKDSKPYPIFDIDTYYHGEDSYGALQIYPCLTKYVDPNRASINAAQGTRDIIEIRLAEMYFIAAEALMKQNKNVEAANYLNVVLRRAAWPGHETDMEVSAADMDIDLILNERALEFGGERMRWETLKRTGKLIERVKAYNPQGRTNVAEKFLLRPIPQDYIDRLTNKNDFKQNPGF